MVVPVLHDCSSKFNVMEEPRRDLIGNSKEFRIDCNKSYLRIIGNGNRIVVNQNCGALDIIGNATSVKIAVNYGKIKYTGNKGKIYIGSDSVETKVDYIGCNGVLKVVSNSDLTEKRRKSKTSKNSTEKDCVTQSPKYAYEKSPSALSGNDENIEGKRKSSTRKNLESFSIKNTISLPNLDRLLMSKTCTSITNSITLSSSNGDIVIRNDIIL